MSLLLLSETLEERSILFSIPVLPAQLSHTPGTRALTAWRGVRAPGGYSNAGLHDEPIGVDAPDYKVLLPPSSC